MSTIDEMQQAQRALEKEICEMLQQFQKSYGVPALEVRLSVVHDMAGREPVVGFAITAMF